VRVRSAPSKPPPNLLCTVEPNYSFDLEFLRGLGNLEGPKFLGGPETPGDPGN
jgi:hypothetical protein